MSNIVYKINRGTRTTQKRKSDIFRWPVVRVQVVSLFRCGPLSLCGLINVSLAVREEETIRPGQCQDRNKMSIWEKKTRSLFKDSTIFLQFIERLLIERLARKQKLSDV